LVSDTFDREHDGFNYMAEWYDEVLEISHIRSRWTVCGSITTRGFDTTEWCVPYPSACSLETLRLRSGWQSYAPGL